MTTTPPVTDASPRADEGLGGPLRLLASVAWQVHGWAARADGRRRTQRILRRMGRTGWRICLDLQLPGCGPVDLAVGPGGAFVLDSKAWDGVVTVDLKGATITPKDSPSSAWTARGHHRSLLPGAACVARTLASTGGPRVPAPRPVVVVWASFPERIADCGGITYVGGDVLADWLSSQPRRLTPEQLASLPEAATWRRPCTTGS